MPPAASSKGPAADAGAKGSLASKTAGAELRQRGAASTQQESEDSASPSTPLPPTPSPRAEILRLSPYTDRFWLPKLFGSSHALTHRVGGLLYLLMFAAAWRAYLTGFESEFLRSPLVWALPLLGVLQSLTATYFFFKILPNKADPGYYGDNAPLNAAFVAENIFFSSLLLFQHIYFLDKGTPLTAGIPFRGAGIPDSEWAALGAAGAAVSAFLSRHGSRLPVLLAELVLVFLPYQVLRPWVPKTSFRASMATESSVTEKNRLFYAVGIRVTKAFYSWAKWFIGIGANMLRFVGLVSPAHRAEWYGLLLCSCFATTISMFLHTLRFKGYIGPKTSFSLYVASYMSTFVYIVRVGDMFLNPSAVPVLVLPLVGLLLNFFAPRSVQAAWQVLSMSALVGVRLGLVELPKAW